MSELSDYAKDLSGESKERYLEKISLISMDPYTLTHADYDKDCTLIPKINRKSILDYLIFKASWETQAEMRAYKSTDAFMQVVCKWVQKVYFKKCGDVYLLSGLVMHLQKLNQPSLKPWLIMSETGEVLCGHCDCVAGLGEVCTHVAAILFAVEKYHDNPESVTDIFAYWKKPTRKPDLHLAIRDINWTVSHGEAESTTSTENSGLPNIPGKSREDIVKFLQEYNEDGQSCVLHNLLKEFSADKPCFPPKIMDLYSKNYEDISLIDLQNTAANLNIEMNESDCVAVEELTRLQAKSRKWFLYRAGRITASKFKAVCRTKVEKPSISLLRSICYPQIYRRVVKQMEYGCKHEKDALKSYLQNHKKEHGNVQLKKVGLVINADFPEFGASPDSYVECSECGEGCVEVKCPFCIKSSPLSDLAEKKNSCLKKHDGKLYLDPQHAYYYQVQMQLFITKKRFCDFVVWNAENIFVQKIMPDEKFWTEEKEKATVFFRKCVLPEVLGKYFTKKSDNVETTATALKEKKLEELEQWNQPGTSKTVTYLKRPIEEILTSSSDEQ